MKTQYYVIVYEHGRWVVKYPLSERLIIGRAEDAHIRVSAAGSKVSRHHASLQVTEEGVRLYDLGSKNKTWLAGRAVQTALLSHGDRFFVGEVAVELATEADTREGMDEVITLVPSAAMGALPHVCALCSSQRGAVTTMRQICERCAASKRGPCDHDTIGSFELLRQHGSGGMGTIYEARRRTDGIHAAVKLIRDDLDMSHVARRRFLREQQVSASFQHPCVVRCLEIGTYQARLYLAAEFIRGDNLETFAYGDVPQSTAISLALDLFSGLAAIHRAGLLHRDIKPSNILVDQITGEPSRKRARITDFGLAKNLYELGVTSITPDGAWAGTPAYIAPEQLLDFKRVGPSADIYSAAATVYFLLSRASHLPVDLDLLDMSTIEFDILSPERVPLRERRADIPEEIGAIIDELVARDPSRRSGLDASVIVERLRAAASEIHHECS